MGVVKEQIWGICGVKGLFRLVFNLYGRVLFYLTRVGSGKMYGENERRCGMCIVTIAYNHEGLIRRQIDLIKRHITDKDYQHVIVDNSTDRRKRKHIRRVCEDARVEYVAIPRWVDRLVCTRIFWHGMSHGAALNWTYYHILKEKRPQRFALLDHDLLPISTYNLTEALGDKDYYGVDRERGDCWYLWPGFSIFRFDALEGKRVDFMPVYIGDNYLDAGGGNYRCLYRFSEYEQMAFPETVTKRVKHTKGLIHYNDIYHGDCLQYIDHAWLHIINGSNYARIPGKEKMVEEVLSTKTKDENEDGLRTKITKTITKTETKDENEK